MTGDAKAGSGSTDQRVPGTSRRTFLKGGGSLAGVGLTARPAVASADRTSSATQADSDTWSNFQYDAANTGHAPNNTGPIANVGEKWRDSGEYQFHLSQAAVTDGTIYFELVTETDGRYESAPGE